MKAVFCDNEFCEAEAVGMARVFAYLMSNPDDMSDKAIFKDVDTTIGNALKKIVERNNKNTFITATGFDIALEQLI